MLGTIYRFLIELTNQKWTSRMLAQFTQSKTSRYVIRLFAKTYKINLNEIEKPLHEYGTLHEFFIRKLKNGVRMADSDISSVISPVDAVIEDIGTITLDHRIMVKEKEYSISEMLGGVDKAQKYQNGLYMIFYLSPSNYHRIHSPLSGTVLDQWELGTTSYPVNKYGLKYGKSPLSKNFRRVTELGINNGVTIAVVKVGAMFVNSVEWLGAGVGDQLEKGEEMAYFSFGSTVVMLFEDGIFEQSISIQVPYPIKVGECIGYIKEEKTKR